MAIKRITIEIIAPQTDGFAWLCLKVKAGSTIAQAITQSGLVLEGKAAVGIWGENKTRDTVVVEGDRIELYLPLLADPMQVRHRKAKQEVEARQQQRHLKKTLKLRNAQRELLTEA